MNVYYMGMGDKQKNAKKGFIPQLKSNQHSRSNLNNA